MFFLQAAPPSTTALLLLLNPRGIFAMRSRQLWEKFAHDIKLQGLDPQDVLGWKKTGSLLVGKTSDDMAVLKGKVDQLSKAGLKAELLSSLDLKKVEPLVVVGEEGEQDVCKRRKI